jgi:hypothetical protein
MVLARKGTGFGLFPTYSHRAVNAKARPKSPAMAWILLPIPDDFDSLEKKNGAEEGVANRL